MSRLRHLAVPVLAASLAVASPLFAQPAPGPGPRPGPGPGSGPGPAQPSGLPAVPTTKVIAIGHVTDKWQQAAIRTVMPREVRETVSLYLQGKVEGWFVRKDQPGVVFIFNATDVTEVHALLEALPLGRERMMEFDLIPVGPLAPLGLLLQPNPESGRPPSTASENGVSRP